MKVQPEDFRVLSGEDALDPSGRFCVGCGVGTYRHMPVAEWNPAAYVSVSVASLDDLPPGDLVAAPVTYYDGVHDNWLEKPVELRQRRRRIHNSRRRRVLKPAARLAQVARDASAVCVAAAEVEE